MSTDEHKAAIRRHFSEVVNQGNLNLIDELFAPNFVFHDPTTTLHGAAFKQLIAMYRTAFPDLELTLAELVAEGDKLAARWTGHGTHRGVLLGIAPTGKSSTLTGIELYRFAGGKAVEGWENFDALGLLQQLGAIPAPAETTS